MAEEAASPVSTAAPNPEKYTRTDRSKREVTPIARNEVRMSINSKTMACAAYAMKLLKEHGHRSVVLSAMGRATRKATETAHTLKRRVPGLHEISETSKAEITDIYDPKDDTEGLDSVEVRREVPVLSITLSLDQLDINHPGYKAPPSPEELEGHADEAARGERSRRSRGRRGRGGRGDVQRTASGDQDGAASPEGEQAVEGGEESRHTEVDATGERGRGRGRRRGGRHQRGGRGRDRHGAEEAAHAEGEGAAEHASQEQHADSPPAEGGHTGGGAQAKDQGAQGGQTEVQQGEGQGAAPGAAAIE